MQVASVPRVTAVALYDEVSISSCVIVLPVMVTESMTAAGSATAMAVPNNIVFTITLTATPRVESMTTAVAIYYDDVFHSNYHTQITFVTGSTTLDIAQKSISGSQGVSVATIVKSDT